mmetsp:Transcript_120221/g.374366  ORF Transcript_120221/g.374366 Transcript_120221/m.374366 type:complete len:245 (-) Transcript_120221:706-1440(-)
MSVLTFKKGSAVARAASDTSAALRRCPPSDRSNSAACSSNCCCLCCLCCVEPCAEAPWLLAFTRLEEERRAPSRLPCRKERLLPTLPVLGPDVAAPPCWRLRTCTKARLLTGSAAVAFPFRMLKDWAMVASSSARSLVRWSQSPARFSHSAVRSFMYSWSSLMVLSAWMRSARVVASWLVRPLTSLSSCCMACLLVDNWPVRSFLVSSHVCFAFVYSASSSAFLSRNSASIRPKRFRRGSEWKL